MMPRLTRAKRSGANLPDIGLDVSVLAYCSEAGSYKHPDTQGEFTEACATEKLLYAGS
jgi:hypothetical protein